MTYDPQKHHRRSIRLKGYDYTQDAAYFLTICVDRGHCLLGEACVGEMILNWRGYIVAGTWLWLAEKYPHVELDIWQVMPNHFHGIILLTGAGAVYDASLGPAVEAGPDAGPGPNLGAGRSVGAGREPPLLYQVTR